MLQKEQISLGPVRTCHAQPIALMSRDLIEAGLGHWVWTPKRVMKSIRNPDTAGVIAESGGKLVGFALMQFGNRDAHLNLLGVRPDLQRRGTGRALFRWLEESARVAGIGRIHLELRAVNKKAYRFYTALGFQEKEQIENYYCGRETAVRMMCDLSREIVITP